VEDLLRFAETLGMLEGNVGEFASSDPIDLGEAYFEVDCRDVEVRRVDEPVSQGDQPVFGLDSQSSMVRFEAADAYVTTGALVGPVNFLVPGNARVRWLALRLRFKASEGLVNSLEGSIGGFALVKSGIINRVFDGTYNEEAVREEARAEVEVGLVRVFRGLGLNGALLMLDGPIFPTPRVLTMASNPYTDLYWGIVRLRVEAVLGSRVIGVVKRLGQSTYYARCRGLSVDDDTMVKNEVSRHFGGNPLYTAVVGPIKIKVGDYAKYCWYVASRLGRGVNVVRVEALDPELAEDGALRAARLMNPGGVPIPIGLADRVSRRLNGGAVKLLASTSPLRLTYEGLEELNRSLMELGD
jgi:hypothetical protein